MTNIATESRIARVHVAEVVPSNYGPDSWHTDSFTDDVVKIRMYGRHQRGVCTWTLLYVGPEGSCRREFGAEPVPGPYAALIPEATVIAATRLPGDRAATVELAEGDLIIIRGIAFRIDDSRGRAGYDPKLVPITG